jgi:hypothetical protein
MPVDPAGVAIGLGGILLAFKGIVDTVNLFDLILAADNGSKFLALKYSVERHRLRVWGDEFKADDELSSPLLRESKATRILIAGILAEIRATHSLAEKFVRRYEVKAPTDSQSYSDTAALSLDGRLVTDMKIERDQRSTRNRFLWATTDKAKFDEVVVRMKSLNDDLYGIVPSDNNEALVSALASYLLPKLRDTLSLQALQQIDTSLDPLLVLSARIKQLHDAPATETAQSATWLDYEKNFVPDRENQTGVRQLGYYDEEGSLGQRSWIEWKTISPSLTAKNANIVLHRIEALAVLLSAATIADFRIPRCVGLLEDATYKGNTAGSSRRLGFVFTFPELPTHSHAKLITLRDALQNEHLHAPLLSGRYTLAYKLASALSLFHASKWLHKGFRSDNIIFFCSEDGTPIITEPYIAGFEYARPDGETSIDVITTGHAELDLYYHPDVGVLGFSRIRDIYSLSVVLFEVALWTTMSDVITKDHNMVLEDTSASQIRAVMLNLIPELGSTVGPSYRDAVKMCLTGDFHTSHDDDGSELARAFFSGVLKRLSYCRA